MAQYDPEHEGHPKESHKPDELFDKRTTVEKLREVKEAMEAKMTTAVASSTHLYQVIEILIEEREGTSRG